MALKFYLNDNEINVETNACLTSTQDESDDSATLVLEWNETPNSILPRTKLRIEDGSDIWNFVVLSDTVEVVDKINGKYKHTLTLSQNTHEMSHYLLRPSTFQQPLPKTCKTIAHGYINVVAHGSSNYTFTSDGVFHNGWQDKYRRDKIHITDVSKIENAVIHLNTYIKSYENITRTVGQNAGFGLIDTAGHRRNWNKNYHTNTTLIVCQYANESDTTPTTTTSISTNGKTDIVIPKSVFQHSGYYQIKIGSLNFNLPSTISFIFNSNLFPTEEAYPTIQAYIDIDFEVNEFKYSLYDVLDYIRLQSQKRLNGSRHQPALFNVNYRLYDLKEIQAPDFKFNGLDVYSAVNEVFSYIDAVATLDVNLNLNYEYINDFNGEKINVDTKKADINARLDDTYFANEMITTYQNAKQPTPINYPARNVFKKLETNNFGVVNANDYKLTTDKPIEKIKKLYIKQTSEVSLRIVASIHYDFFDCASIQFGSFYFPNQAIDISACVFDSNIFALLPYGSPDSIDANQYNSLSVAIGSKEIAMDKYEIDGITYQRLDCAVYRAALLSWNWDSSYILSFTNLQTAVPFQNVYYSIEYYANLSGQAMVESIENKESGQFQVGQTSSSVAINKMGSNMLGIISKLGNEKKVVTLDMSSYGSRIKKGSVWEDDNGYKWIANTVKTTFSVSSNCVINEVEFVKNFNSINRRTQIDKEVRYYEIDKKLTSKGYENINEFIYFSTQDEIDSFAHSIAFANVQTIISQMFYEDSNVRADFAKVSFDNGSTYDYIPMHTYGLGNVICFEMELEEPNSTGKYVSEEDGKIICQPKLINDYCDTVKIRIYDSHNLDLAGVSKYPIVENNFGTEIISIDYDYYKRLNEIFHLNYGIAFMPMPNEQIYFGERFISGNCIINGNSKPNSYRLFISQTETYGINDRKPLGTEQTQNVAVSVSSERILIQANATEDDAISWCLTDENGDILIACNENITAASGAVSRWVINLYYGTRKQRVLQ